MIRLKNVLAWIATAFFGILLIFALFAAASTWAVMTTEGTGGVGAVSAGFFEALLLPIIVVSALGFWWTLRRARKQSRTM